MRQRTCIGVRLWKKNVYKNLEYLELFFFYNFINLQSYISTIPLNSPNQYSSRVLQFLSKPRRSTSAAPSTEFQPNKAYSLYFVFGTLGPSLSQNSFESNTYAPSCKPLRNHRLCCRPEFDWRLQCRKSLNCILWVLWPRLSGPNRIVGCSSVIGWIPGSRCGMSGWLSARLVWVRRRGRCVFGHFWCPRSD